MASWTWSGVVIDLERIFVDALPCEVVIIFDERWPKSRLGPRCQESPTGVKPCEDFVQPTEAVFDPLLVHD